MLQARREDELIRAIWEAKQYRPDGIVTVSDILSDISKPLQVGYPWFLDSLTKLTYGRREGSYTDSVQVPALVRRTSLPSKLRMTSAP